MTGSSNLTLADEADEAVPSPRTRLAPAQLTTLARVLTSAEAPGVRRDVSRRPPSRELRPTEPRTLR